MARTARVSKLVLLTDVKIRHYRVGGVRVICRCYLYIFLMYPSFYLCNICQVECVRVGGRPKFVVGNL
jgi:hypothetical protein